jgi:hypothetical protein
LEVWSMNMETWSRTLNRRRRRRQRIRDMRE